MKRTAPARHFRKTHLLAICVFLATGAFAQQETDELIIYDHMSAVGTVARRVFTNEKGQMVKVIHYRAKDFSPRPKKENELIPCAIELHTYDELGRKVWMGDYSPTWILSRTSEDRYGLPEQTKTTYARKADGTLTVEERRYVKGGGCILYFDDEGKDLMAFRGVLRPDINLPSGWGQEVDGLACGVGINRRAGKLKDLHIQIMVRNHSDEARDVVTCLPYQEIKIELRDAAGKLVPQAAEHIRARDQKLQEMNPGGNETTQTLRPHYIELYSGGHCLEDWYANLPPGAYALTVFRRANGPGFPLKSNPLTLQIIPD
jgi:uncharacterized protein (DUF2141 family)